MLSVSQEFESSWVALAQGLPRMCRQEVGRGCRQLKAWLRLRAGDDKLRSTGQMWPTACIYKYSSLGTQPLSFIHILLVAAFAQQRQNWVVLIETVWPTHHNYLRPDSLQRLSANPQTRESVSKMVHSLGCWQYVMFLVMWASPLAALVLVHNLGGSLGEMWKWPPYLKGKDWRKRLATPEW